MSDSDYESCSGSSYETYEDSVFDKDWEGSFRVVEEWFDGDHGRSSVEKATAKLSLVGVLNEQNQVDEFLKNVFILVVRDCHQVGANGYRNEAKRKMECLATFLSKLITYTYFEEPENRECYLRSVLNLVARITMFDCGEVGIDGFAHMQFFLHLLEQQCADNSSNVFVMDSFARVLTMLQPACLPKFALHWLGIIGDGRFLKAFLVDCLDLRSSRQLYAQLLAQGMKFLSTTLDSLTATFSKALLILVMKLQYCPDVLLQNANVLASFVPLRFEFIQLRNVILCAFPLWLKPIDPFSADFASFCQLPDMSADADINCEFQVPLRSKLERALKSFFFSHDVTPAEIHDLILDKSRELSKSKYDVPLVCSLVLRLGILDIEDHVISKCQISEDTVSKGSVMLIISGMCDVMGSEGHYTLISAIVNQLRYPSICTRYFMSLLLALFLKHSDDMREVITRVLVERLMVFRPHPWGLMVVMIELVKNEKYQLSKCEFMRATPGVRGLMRDICLTCGVDVDHEGSEADVVQA